MIPILSHGPDRIELNALFIQPTRWCGLNCKGCYVKEHTGGETDRHINWIELSKLFKLFYIGPHWANQITISVDDLSKDIDQRKHMLLAIDGILGAIFNDDRKDQDRPEVHMTLHTPNTLQQYLSEGVIFQNALSMVSFSEMPLTKESLGAYNYFKNHNVPINFNHMAPHKWNAEREIDKISTILENIAQHMYLVMFKEPVGGPSGDKVNRGREIWNNFQLYISEVIDKLPRDVRSKITIDGCVSDTIKHSRTGFGCSSNVSRIQVWPNGSVSGCPYAFSGSTEVAITTEGIMANIRKAKQQYDFKEKCHLPSVYTSLGGRSGFRILQL